MESEPSISKEIKLPEQMRTWLNIKANYTQATVDSVVQDMLKLAMGYNSHTTIWVDSLYNEKKCKQEREKEN